MVVTRRISAGEVIPARHFSTPSSTIVVIPACIAALSIETESVCQVDQVPNLLRYLEDFEHPNAAAIARAAASLTFAWFENCFANFQADRAIARVAGKIGL